ncbi:MAG: class I SAM-dependent methyltransferase [Planctomycetaceae bacterium]
MINRRSIVLAAALVVLVSLGSAIGQKPRATKPRQTKRYSFRRLHDPNGIGKFYMGREIARVMGYGFQGAGARWLERVEREREERLSLMVRSLKLKPGQSVADIGAGSGVVTALLASAVGVDGKVMAVDVQPQMLQRLKLRMKRFGVKNVVPVLSNQKTPKLKPASVDLVIMVDVYHEFEFPFEMTFELSKALKPGGRAAFVEYRMEDPRVPIKLIHKMTEAQVKKEIGQASFGLKFKETIRVLPRQHIVIFEKSAGKLPPPRPKE